MRALRVLLPVLLLSFALFAPLGASAATTDFFGELFPTECKCEGSAPEWGCVMIVLQNLINLGISVGVLIFVLVAAFAGILWMTSPMNPRNREMGRSMLLNAVVGLVIALSSWLLVDFVMKALYNPGAGFGPWNSILDGNADKKCLVPRNTPVGEDGGILSDGSEFPDGTRVSCLYPGGGRGNQPGTVRGRENETQHLLLVEFDERTDPNPHPVSPGDCNFLNVDAADMAAVRNFSVGQQVECQQSDGGTYYPGQVTQVDTGRGWLRVTFSGSGDNLAIGASHCRAAGGAASGNEAAVREQLSNANISVNNTDACPAGETYQAYRARTGRRCTTVGGLTSGTITHAINMSNSWGSFQITGGSEAGHATHDNGTRFDAVGGNLSDIRSLPAASAAQKSRDGLPSGGTVYADSCGNTYYDEGDHWHITVVSACNLGASS